MDFWHIYKNQMNIFDEAIVYPFFTVNIPVFVGI